jgi:hypothetical protein
MLSSVADVSPQPARSKVVSSPKRSRVRKLTTVDRRTVAAKRIAELRALFTNELLSAGAELTPLRRFHVQAAAEAVAMAEAGRGRFLRGQATDLSDVVSAERVAALAVRRLGLPVDAPKPAAPTVAPADHADLSQLSTDQLDRLEALLTEGKEGSGTPLATPAATTLAQEARRPSTGILEAVANATEAGPP